MVMVWEQVLSVHLAIQNITNVVMFYQDYGLMVKNRNRLNIFEFILTKILGMDVLAVKEGLRFAIDHAVNKGPIVLEAATYRYSGHSMSDPGTSYRSRDEIQEVRQKRDPITSFKERLIESGLANADELKQIEAEVKKEVDAAHALSKSDTEIAVNELTCDIYSTNLAGDVRSATPDILLKHTTLKKAVNM